LNTKLKCLLLDDELQGLTYLKLLCEQIPELEIVRAFNDSFTFLKECLEIESDLCILDIEMPGLNGIQVANLLKGKPVIFVTAYKEYALDAFELDAIDYLQKPVQLERLQQAIHKAVKRIESNQSLQKYFQVNTDKGRALIYFDQLVHIKTSETDSRDKVARMRDNSALLLKNISFDKLMGILPSGQFCQVNKKEILALKSVHFFSHNEITTRIPGENSQPLVLTLSELYRKNFIQNINPSCSFSLKNVEKTV
jgi:DNA-binding LytR/AlgR family response regulator